MGRRDGEGGDQRTDNKIGAIGARERGKRGRGAQIKLKAQKHRQKRAGGRGRAEGKVQIVLKAQKHFGQNARSLEKEARSLIRNRRRRRNSPEKDQDLPDKGEKKQKVRRRCGKED